MRGEKIEQARAAIEYCLSHLNPADRFNVIAFGTQVRAFREGPVSSSKTEIGAARQFIETMAVAEGEAESEQELESADESTASDDSFIVGDNVWD